MNENAMDAPVADWVTIPELYHDPFPTFERLRSEGGVHWVPAVNRFLITSYAAVHDTELDQSTFSANEEGSLMIRAMGHSMLRRDDPEHYAERRAWQPVLKPAVVKKTWLPVFEQTAERYLREFLEKGPGADLVWDFAAPYAAESLRGVMGLHNATQQDLQRWSQTMIDATGNYADDPEVWARGQASYDEVDVALDEMIAWYRTHEDHTMLSALLRLPDYQMPLEAIRANVKMTIGGGLNEPRDAIGVAAWAMLTHPEQRRAVEADPSRWDAVFDETLRWVAPIGMYSRQTTREVVLQGVRLPAKAKLGICILSANRDDSVWPAADRFDIDRAGTGMHLGFGKGIHVCLGAWVARAEVATVALPKLFSRIPSLTLLPENPPELGGWVFRGVTRMPVSWTASSTTTTQPAFPEPTIAVIGSGPAGCYSAQALRKSFPAAQISVIDRLPVPYGLVRYGVAADHQGTKAISEQFARLFEKDGVEFIGNTTVGNADAGADVSLDDLRSAFDVVVLATGLHADAPLDIPGADLPGVHGSGRITRLLNAHPLETRPVPRLGETVGIVGTGNVAMDVIRLLAKQRADLSESDVDVEAHDALAGAVRVLHVIGRSMPAEAKFDPVMLREIVDLPGVRHVVHGVDLEDAAADDSRSELVSALIGHAPAADARLRIEWWFGYTPEELSGDDRVSVLRIRSLTDASTHVLDLDDVVTAIGFAAAPGQALLTVPAHAQASGRIADGLYVAGWARRGPRGTIPAQRTDSRELAELIRAEVPVGRKPGRAAILAGIGETRTSYDGWLLVDAHESASAGPDMVRAKLTSLDEMVRIAGAAGGLPTAGGATHHERPGSSSAGLPPLTILFGTESGNAELVADELATHLADRFDACIVDLATASAADLDRDRLTIVICSTYGDGELPTGAREFHRDVLESEANLAGLRYAVFGLGDSSYSATYSRGSEILDEALSAGGAVRVGEFGRHDAAGRQTAPDAAAVWADELVAQFTADSLRA